MDTCGAKLCDLVHPSPVMKLSLMTAFWWCPARSLGCCCIMPAPALTAGEHCPHPPPCISTQIREKLGEKGMGPFSKASRPHCFKWNSLLTVPHLAGH